MKSEVEGGMAAAQVATFCGTVTVPAGQELTQPSTRFLPPLEIAKLQRFDP
jgi:hypothetical protein